MNSTTHMAIGGMTGGLVLAHCVSSSAMSVNFSGYEIYGLVVTAAAAVGGISPDIDMAHSKAGRPLRKILRAAMIISAVLLVIMSFVPSTGIGLLDRLVDMSAGIDRQIPLVLAGFCILIMFVIERSKHRGFTHTPIGLLVVAAPLIYMLLTGTAFVGADIVVSVQIGFLSGWLSHMAIDTFNRPGVPWLWPFVPKHFNIMSVKSGSKEEKTFLWISAAGFAVCYALILGI